MRIAAFMSDAFCRHGVHGSGDHRFGTCHSSPVYWSRLIFRRLRRRYFSSHLYRKTCLLILRLIVDGILGYLFSVMVRINAYSVPAGIELDLRISRSVCTPSCSACHIDLDIFLDTLTPATTSTIPTVTDNLFSQGTITSDLVAVSFEPTTSLTSSNGELTWGWLQSSPCINPLLSMLFHRWN